MKTMRTKAIATISAFVIAMMVIAGITIATESAVNAQEIENYDLIIIEEEALPAAAAPVDNHSGVVKWVIIAALLITVVTSYEIWYERLYARVQSLNYGNYDGRELGKHVSRLHPIRLVNAKKEMEISAAQHYFYVR